MNRLGLKSLLLGVGLAGSAVFGLFAARSAVAQGDCPSKQDRYTIGFANLTGTIRFPQLVEQGLVETAAALGNVDLLIADNKADGSTALTNMENFINQGVDAVIEYQTDAAFGNVIMSRARSADLPVIAVDIPMVGATYFGADNYYAGQLAGAALAEWVNQHWGGQADAALMLELPQSGNIPAARMQGMIDAFQANVATPLPPEQIYHLDSMNTEAQSFRVVSETLPQIADDARIVAFTINDGAGIGTIAAAEAAGRGEQIMVVGQNADPTGQAEMLKENSRYLGATAYFPESYGSKLLPTMISILECQPVPPSVYVDHVFISAANVCDYYPESWPETCGAAEMTPEAASASG